MGQDWSLKQALEFVTQQRPQVSPNAGFMARLIRLEQSLHGTKTVTVTSLEPGPLLSVYTQLCAVAAQTLLCLSWTPCVWA